VGGVQLRSIHNPSEHCAMHLFVTVGTTSFDALLEVFDRNDAIEMLNCLQIDQITLQTGHTRCKFSHLRLADSLAVTIFDYADEIGSYISSADIVLSHGGAGTILDVLSRHVRLCVVPNPALHQNHQLELVSALEKEGYLLHSTIDSLWSVLEEVLHHDFHRYESDRGQTFAVAFRGLVSRPVSFFHT